jgi:hypothetical protein
MNGLCRGNQIHQLTPGNVLKECEKWWGVGQASLKASLLLVAAGNDFLHGQ